MGLPANVMVYQHFKANFRHRYLLNNVFQNSGKLDMGYGYGSEQAKTKHPKSQRSLEFNTLYICIYVYFIYIMYVLYSTVHISHSRNMYSTSIPYCIPKQQSFIPTAAVLKKVYVGCQRSPWGLTSLHVPVPRHGDAEPGWRFFHGFSSQFDGYPLVN